VPLAAADGRVVAHDVISALDVPPFDRSAMDGYAVQSADLAGASAERPVSLTCVARLFTGEIAVGELRRGECIQIATGAPMPAGADAVVMVEDTSQESAAADDGARGAEGLAEAAVGFNDGARGAKGVPEAAGGFNDGARGAKGVPEAAGGFNDGARGAEGLAEAAGGFDDGARGAEGLAEAGVVFFKAPAKAGQNIGRRAADITIGTPVVTRGQTLTPSRIGALAATGHRTVEVLARPAVAVVSTGNEVVQPGLPLPPGHIYDINRFTLESVARRHGGAPVALASPGDSIEELDRILDTASQYDLIVFSGGSSVGDRDLVRDVIAARGEMLFHGIAVKPGKPTAFARIGDALFFGMPGNPTSCLSNAYILLVPVLRKLAGLPAWEPRTVSVPLGTRIASSADRHQFYTVRIVDGRAEPAFKGSGDITSMANADGYIEIPARTDTVEAGTMVTVALF
jgi:molybdenum cofactor synthesis domain-containing protein